MRSVVLVSGAALMMLAAASCPAQERVVTVLARGTLNTAGRLFPNPNATDPVARAQARSYSDSYGVGAEVQYHVPGSNITLSISSEYIRNSGTSPIPAGGGRRVEVEDSYRIIPVEFTGYFRIPVTDGSFSMFMGGGVGMYWGSRYYAIAGVEAPTTNTNAGFGIHVLGGVAYRVNEVFSVTAEVKFRDAQFETTNAFQSASARYGNIVVSLPQLPFESRIHSDGMVIGVGLGVSL